MNSTSFFILADNLPVGLQARILRIRRGWRQVDLALTAGVSQADVSALECGRLIATSVRRRLLETLGLEVGEC